MSRLQLVCGPGRIFPWRGRAEVWTLDIYSIFLYRLPLPFVKLMYLVRFFFTSCGESSLRWYIARFAVSILPKAVWKCRALRSVKILSAWTSLNECFRKRTVMTNYERKASADLFHLWKVYMQTMWGGGGSSFYLECRNAMRYILRVNERLSDTQVLFQKGCSRWSYYELGLTKKEKEKSFAPFGFRHPVWNASIMTRHHSPR